MYVPLPSAECTMLLGGAREFVDGVGGACCRAVMCKRLTRPDDGDITCGFVLFVNSVFIIVPLMAVFFSCACCRSYGKKSPCMYELRFAVCVWCVSRAKHVRYQSVKLFTCFWRKKWRLCGFLLPTNMAEGVGDYTWESTRVWRERAATTLCIFGRVCIILRLRRLSV